MAKKKRGIKKNVRQVFQYYDYNLLVSVILLTCFGLIMLYSSSAYSAQIKFRDDMYYFTKQAAISAFCLVAVIVGSQIDYHILTRNFAGWLYLIANILLFLTKFIGTELNGAKRWIYFGPVSFQPAEMAKVAIILFLPTLIVKMGKNMRTWPAFFTVLIAGGVTSFLTYVFTDNLSTAIIIAGITVGLLFIVFPDSRPFVAGVILVAVVAIAVVWYVKGSVTSDSFRLRRVQVWLNPEANSSVGGYQVMQGLYAIGSGGFFGKGLGNSLQKLDYVPEAQNDMIFSIVCEETGILGAFLVLFLFGLLIWRLCMLALNCRDLKGTLLCAGIMAHMSIQVVLNVAVVTNTIPNTGITLPFVSYGGTSVVFLLGEMGLALSVSSHRHGRIT